MLTNSKFEPFIQDVFKNYKINTKLRQAHFLAQVSHESGGFTVISENLNYTKADRLPVIFKSPFDLNKNGKIDPAEIKFAEGYIRNPQKLANYVYANRMGNGNVTSGDGWKYRGKGLIQLTGKTTQTDYAKSVGVNIEEKPDFLLEPKYAVDSAGWFWAKNNLNALADKDDIVTITKKINGGTNGLDHRRSELAKFKKKLGI